MYDFDLLGLEDFQIKELGKKSLYNLDGQKTASDWCKEDLKGKKVSESIQLKNPLLVGSSHKVKTVKNKLGYLDSLSNSVQYNTQRTAIYSVGFSARGGFSIIPENLFKCSTFFSSRKLINKNWINDKDEYCVPNVAHQNFSNFESDSLVHSIFNSSSNQSSLRQIEYKNQLWDIKNEFFWISVDKMKELADQNGYDELYNDARTSSDRYVHKLLFGEERIYDRLSLDAKAVLDKATELVERSMELRQVMANEENHLNSWDAGYAQLKLVWKEYFQDEFTEFRQLYKALEDRMRPLVYELGFLKK